jgi:hypothetical protein
MVTGSPDCLPTCCRLSVITLALTRTVESIKKVHSTANGFNFENNHPTADRLIILLPLSAVARHGTAKLTQ